ncbi:hypothetical protein PAPYR_8781 [Paratrimastix pyriformis]|uniref:COPI associated protein n=1 Tax=Paratrimastix pyriformis TaxID=342808 RepID=A0ABQ8UFD0_9EUKA|nr:hypothetical protein PAPYR_8781 [Paratrimastix pyriformis]
MAGHKLANFLFNVLTIASIIVDLFAAVVAVLMIVFLFPLTTIEAVIRMILFACLVVLLLVMILGETESKRLLQFAAFLRYWPGRSIPYLFIGLVILSNTASNAIINILRQIAGWAVVSLGLLYFLLGVTCVQRVKFALRGEGKVGSASGVGSGVSVHEGADDFGGPATYAPPAAAPAFTGEAAAPAAPTTGGPGDFNWDKPGSDPFA